MNLSYDNNLPIFGEPLDNAVQQMHEVMKHGSVVAGALMGDHHLGYSQPIGGVIAYSEHISPSGVGFDIACGNKAVLLDTPAKWLRENISDVMDTIFERVQFGIGKTNNLRPDFRPLEDDPAWDIPFVGGLKDLASEQLGTVGSGNHYVDLFIDERDEAWVGVHFGSRGLGHKIATEYIKRGGGKNGIHSPPALLEIGTADAEEYIAAMTLAGRYAYAGRDWVCDEVARILGAEQMWSVHNHHNFAWQESHGDSLDDLWVVRKGATPAFPGQDGFVGATRSEQSVILRGTHPARLTATETVAQKVALFSTVHGAGRTMSRTQAAGRWRWRRPEGGGEKVLVQTREGEISQSDVDAELVKSGVELRGSGLDEAPAAYKRLGDVLAAHGETVHVINALTPIGVAMAGGGR